MTAREQLKKAGVFNKELAALAGQSTSKNLQRRCKDFDGMIDAAKGKNMQGYNRPGSLKK